MLYQDICDKHSLGKCSACEFDYDCTLDREKVWEKHGVYKTFDERFQAKLSTIKVLYGERFTGYYNEGTIVGEARAKSDVTTNIPTIAGNLGAMDESSREKALRAFVMGAIDGYEANR